MPSSEDEALVRQIVAEEMERLIAADPNRFMGLPGLLGERGSAGVCQCHEPEEETGQA